MIKTKLRKKKETVKIEGKKKREVEAPQSEIG